jgi:predicted membrane protein
MDRFDRRGWGGNRMRGHGGLVGGVILAMVGLFLLLQNLGIPYFDDLERYWPLIMIVGGGLKAARSMDMSGRIWGGMVVLAGIVFLLNNFGLIHGDVWRFIWPGALIVIGLGMLARSIDRNNSGYQPESAKVTAEKVVDDIHKRIKIQMGEQTRSTVDRISEWAIFGGSRRRVDSQNFQGGEAFAMFGGVEIDLRRAATTATEIVVDANAIFGGVEVRVPETWNITVRGAGIFGGYEDETMDSRVTPDSKQPNLIVTGFAIFGGVNVKN